MTAGEALRQNHGAEKRSVQLWVALADEAQRAIGAASRDREGPRGNASGMGGSEGKGAGGAQ